MSNRSPDHSRSRLEMFSGAASALTILLGVLVIVGWTWDLDRLKRVFPGLVSMNPMTATSFILAAVSLWLQRRPPPKPTGSPPLSLRRCAQFCVLLTLGIGLLKLTTYALGWEFGVDQVLFAEKLGHDSPTLPNRMAPNTALNFVFLSSALLLLDVTTRRGLRPAEVFAGAIALNSLLALIGYAYQVQWLYGLARFIPMALHTAAGFQLLALGILCARRDAGLMALVTSESPGGAMARRLFPGMVSVLFVLGWLRLEGERREFYEAELGVALHTSANIAIFGALIWWSARSLHRADAERQRTETQRDRFFTLSLDLLCIAGMDGYFKRLNPAFQQTLGYTTKELLARPFLDFVHPDDRAVTLAEMEKLSHGEPTLQFENRYQCKDRSWKWLSWRVQPFPSEGLLYATAHDITERKQSEAAIQQLNADLQQRAAQLEEVNKELESFSYSVSHDLRAPLRHVQGYVEMLQRASDGQLSDKARRYLKTITDASSEMGQLIDDLLAFSRMGRIELHETCGNLDGFVRDTIKGLEMATQGRNINWKIAPLPQVLGDPSMLKQVFANLIGNAIKYSHQRDQAEIEIGCAGVEDGRVILFVRDNGAGFDMQYAHKLFGVFQRLHRADEFEGTGIGLATVRRVIVRHGGRTWAEGNVGEGATFYFTLKPATGVPA